VLAVPRSGVPLAPDSRLSAPSFPALRHLYPVRPISPLEIALAPLSSSRKPDFLCLSSTPIVFRLPFRHPGRTYTLSELRASPCLVFTPIGHLSCFFPFPFCDTFSLSRYCSFVVFPFWASPSAQKSPASSSSKPSKPIQLNPPIFFTFPGPSFPMKFCSVPQYSPRAQRLGTLVGAPFFLWARRGYASLSVPPVCPSCSMSTWGGTSGFIVRLK